MTVNSLAPTGFLTLAAGTTSSRALIPTAGSPTVVNVTNAGDRIAYVALGDNTVVASQAAGTPVMPKENVNLTIGSATYIAGVSLFGICGLQITASTYAG